MPTGTASTRRSKRLEASAAPELDLGGVTRVEGGNNGVARSWQTQERGKHEHLLVT